MTLRTRLTAAFLVVMLGPVLLGAVFVGYTVGAVGQDRSEHQLEVAAGAVRSAVAALCQRLHSAAELVAMRPPQQRPAAAQALAGSDLVAAVRVLDADGWPVVATEGGPLQPWADCAGPGGGGSSAAGGQAPGPAGGGGAGQARALAASVVVPDLDGEVWVAARLDRALVERLAAAAGVALTVRGAGPAGLLTTDEQVDSSLAAADGLMPGRVTESEDGRWVRRLEPTDGQPLSLVLATPGGGEQPGFYPVLSAVVAVAGLLAVLAAWRLARSTTRPLAELAQAADRVADGDLAARVPVRTADEAGRLAATFNRMTQRMQSYVQALTASRDQLRRHLAVLGDTLSGTHDLDQILRVILQTARAATSASGGAVLLVDERSRILVGHATGEPAELAAGDSGDSGAEPESRAPLTVPLGEGLLGEVAATGQARRGRVTPDGPVLHPAEPGCRTFVVVPITAAGGVQAGPPWATQPSVRGVLALYDRLGDDDFDESDLVTLRTFAGQAGVAVDNVRIHLEAQRLSLTDPLTGLWNYRYLKESLRREVERASRFSHPLAVLVLDLDRFKDVNDAYGHPAGDAVLAEFAQRIRSVIREVDLAFRHGGEEFAIMLPETGRRGATVLAQRLGAAVRDEPMVIAARGGGGEDPGGELPISVTVSIGVAVYPEHAQVPGALLEAADDALYAAKAAGRDTYRVATVAPAGRGDPGLPVQAGGGQSGGGEPERPPAGGAQPPRQTRGR